MINDDSIKKRINESENHSNRLGRGLASLIGDSSKNMSIPDKAEAQTALDIIPIEYIQANTQNPRRVFHESELIDLSNSIKEKGILQPIIVRAIDGSQNTYEVVAGERRWRAAQIAKLDQIPVIIKTLSDVDALEIAIIENVQRSNLSPIEEATGYKNLIDTFSYTQDDLAKVIGKSRSYVANTLRLMNLPVKVIEYLSNGELTAGHARALLSTMNAEVLADLIVKKGLSVRQTENLVKSSINNQTDKLKVIDVSTHNKDDVEIRDLEKNITTELGFNVKINNNSNNSGKVVIKYLDLDQLDLIRKRLLGK
ncbi:ParB/RepB/Spo0J family partition protein [Hyphomicrobiales bacterium]|jgi:ParB family chromosome partitioning protein|nr:ParB/RepB/Spo0J family partition protein [Rhodobiaceae bacterium]MBT6222369.1 ParB/RepB/Spo0J family partition protein [Rhodobiaceae bacterium]MDB4831163.1 ParB/RepB/Spo0J family partition protein [Hyphomicrobiales bacterium]MDC0139649.1 ParB/RepB/Spo0J family partition protein [Hyphomicrobiales bacterium]MDC3272041.1 ParB/RepB/Spo0J family partition protein [Hyphomicrobiales bacterium]|tara:strand:+ start:825 stop:1757 length:933 start_codon:yes stop_codon:yes gene_type:complete